MKTHNKHFKQVFPCGISLPRRPIVRVGDRAGNLVVIGAPFYAQKYKSAGSVACAVCRCDCGIVVAMTCNALASGNSKSCSNRCGHKTHGKSKTPEFTVWRAMKKRCSGDLRGRESYRRKGIQVCGRWMRSFELFYADMGPRPSTRHTLERVDNSGDYCPENCVWALPHQQARNRDTCRYLVFRGKRMIITDVAAIVGIPRNTIYARLRMGWSMRRAISAPIQTKQRRTA
jgi:hypothetical protein